MVFNCACGIAYGLPKDAVVAAASQLSFITAHLLSRFDKQVLFPLVHDRARGSTREARAVDVDVDVEL